MPVDNRATEGKQATATGASEVFQQVPDSGRLWIWAWMDEFEVLTHPPGRGDTYTDCTERNARFGCSKSGRRNYCARCRSPPALLPSLLCRPGPQSLTADRCTRRPRSQPRPPGCRARSTCRRLEDRLGATAAPGTPTEAGCDTTRRCWFRRTRRCCESSLRPVWRQRNAV